MTRIGTKIAAPLAAALAALFLAAGCGGGGAATGAVPDDCKPKVKLPTSQEGKLIVAGPEYPPLFSYQDRKIGGVDGDILLDFAADACLELEVKVLPASGVIESVKTGRADIAAGGWYITPDRAKVVGQSDPVYSDPPVLVSKKPVSKIEDLKGKT
ncbi:MAG: substrate-binding periplasmic protein, partial [Micromonosporaceae bacterium]